MTKKRRGRPPLPMPEPLPDGVTPEELARAIMQGPPKKRWRYLDEHNARTAGAQGEQAMTWLAPRRAAFCERRNSH